MKHFEMNWKSSDGLEIFAQGWDPDVATPAAVACLVHGLGEHSGRYLTVAEALTREGYSIFGADLRGHGKSGGPRGHFTSIEPVLDDINLLLQQANNRYPGIPLILYGHSMGGILVLYYALKRKSAIKGVISTSPALQSSVAEQPIKMAAARVLGSIFPSVTIPSGLDVSAISRDKEVLMQCKNDPLINYRVSLGFGKIMLDVTNWTVKHKMEFSLPLLLLHGKADRIAYPSGSIDFAGSLDGNCKLVLWEDAFHELHHEPHKAEVFKTMTNWIKDLISNDSVE